MKTTCGDPHFDLRTLPRALRENRVNQKELDDYLKKLPDESKNAEEIKLGEEKSSPKPKGPRSKTKAPTFSPANEAEAT